MESFARFFGGVFLSFGLVGAGGGGIFCFGFLVGLGVFWLVFCLGKNICIYGVF